MRAAVLLACLLLVGCKPIAINVSEGCAVIRATLYHDGTFALAPDEVVALHRATKEKIVAVKNWYRDNCKR
jgi:hypothetical protein